jgi:hypothetical protein
MTPQVPPYSEQGEFPPLASPLVCCEKCGGVGFSTHYRRNHGDNECLEHKCQHCGWVYTTATAGWQAPKDNNGLTPADIAMLSIQLEMGKRDADILQRRWTAVRGLVELLFGLRAGAIEVTHETVTRVIELSEAT